MKPLISLLLGILAFSSAQAQTALPAAGGDASGSGGTVSYTVGQVAYTTISSDDHAVAQGVQQPYEISVITAIENAGAISLNAIVYPNPASDQVRLKTDGHETGQLRYDLHDMNGRLLITGKVDGDETSIAIGHLASAAYILSITERNIAIKRFSLIKR